MKNNDWLPERLKGLGAKFTADIPKEKPVIRLSDSAMEALTPIYKPLLDDREQQGA